MGDSEILSMRQRKKYVTRTKTEEKRQVETVIVEEEKRQNHRTDTQTRKTDGRL